MAIIFSPLDQSELTGPFEPRPRTAFIMRQLGEPIDAIDKELIETTSDILKKAKFKLITAADIVGSTDFLQKIIDLIRGCGFGLAIFSDKTPAKTLANIFYEVGIATVLGKPVQLVITGSSPVPSDFVRTEWISYDIANKTKLRADLRKSLKKMESLGDYYRKIGEVALAGAADLELAFERFKQAVLISDSAAARSQLTNLKQRLDGRPVAADDLASHHRKLQDTITQFITLLPPAT